jgi:hypothetical protein
MVSKGSSSQDYVKRTYDYGHKIITQHSGPDGELWDLLTKTTMPRLSSWKAIICAVLNLFIAGSGTVLSGFLEDTQGNQQKI